MKEVLAHRQGGSGKKSFLDDEQKNSLKAEVAKGVFRTASEMRHWIKERFGVQYKLKSIYGLMRTLGCSPKIPRPRHEKTDVEAQKQWKLRGLRDALIESGMSSGDDLFFSDEARVGLYGASRSAWGKQGVKIIQLVQVKRVWKYLFVVVSPITGALFWAWIDSMSKEDTIKALSEIREQADIHILVWDGASSHKTEEVRSVESIISIVQPPYSPELNPVERLFQEVRRWTDGVIYDNIEQKMAAADAYLRELASDPQRVISLCGYEWIKDAVHSLPTSTPPAAS